MNFESKEAVRRTCERGLILEQQPTTIKPPETFGGGLLSTKVAHHQTFPVRFGRKFGKLSAGAKPDERTQIR